MLKAINRILLSVFVLITIMALAAVLYGAIHQLLIAAIAAIMSATLFFENEKKEANDEN